MPKPILNVNNTNQTSRNRSIVRMVWNGDYIKDSRRKIGTFRTLYNAGDPLSRVNYSCGGPNPLQNLPSVKQNVSLFRQNMKSICDSSGVPAAATNVKYVYDSSLFTRFRKEVAVNKSYSDPSYGGSNNGAYTALTHIRV